jgi:hypothetical protein
MMKLGKFVDVSDNVHLDVGIDHVGYFVTHELGIEVLSLYEVKPRRRRSDGDHDGRSGPPRRAFRVCIYEDQCDRFLVADKWPRNVVINDWYFNKTDDVTSDQANSRPRSEMSMDITAQYNSRSNNIINVMDLPDPSLIGDAGAISNSTVQSSTTEPAYTGHLGIIDLPNALDPTNRDASSGGGTTATGVSWSESVSASASASVSTVNTDSVVDMSLSETFNSTIVADENSVGETTILYSSPGSYPTNNG